MACRTYIRARLLRRRGNEIRTYSAGRGHAAARPGDSSRLSRLHQLCRRGREARVFERLSGRAPLHRLWPGLGLDEPAGLSGRPHRADPARHRRRRAALAQPDPGRRAGGDPRPVVERPARFRGRQGLSRLRILRLLHSARGGDRAVRRGDGRHPQGVDEHRAGSRITASGGISTTSSSSRARSSSRIRRSGSAPAAPSRSAARRATATTCCSTRSRRPI